MRNRQDDLEDENDVISYRKHPSGEPLRTRRRYEDDVRFDVPLPHSKFGIASFAMAIIVGVIFLIVFAFGVIMEMTTPGGLPEDTPETMVLGLFVILSLLFDLVALALGIAGWCESNRRKVFAILGTTFSAGTMLLGLVLIVIGALAE